MNDKIYQLLRGNNYELALKELDEILKNSDKSHHGSIYTLMGLCQRNLGQTANAKKSFTRALKTSPKSDAYLCNMGLVLIDEQDYHHALYFLNKSLKVNPKNFNAIENKIIVSANTAPLDQTLRLIDHQPDFNSAKRIFLTAYAYQKNNQFEQAIKLYIQASKYPEYQIAGLFSAISCL
jgi:tetratricopeptide (TPR) repeat protein